MQVTAKISFIICTFINYIFVIVGNPHSALIVNKNDNEKGQIKKINENMR